MFRFREYKRRHYRPYAVFDSLDEAERYVGQTVTVRTRRPNPDAVVTLGPIQSVEYRVYYDLEDSAQ